MGTQMDLVYKLNQHSKFGHLCCKFLQPPTYALMSCVSKIVLFRHRLNIVGNNTLHSFLTNRLSNQSIITVSNHHSCLDDFLQWGSLLSVRDLLNGIPVWRKFQDNKSGKVIYPGGGVYQPSIDFCISLLNSGQWLHVYPQGRVIQPYERHLEDSYQLRWGIGRLIAEVTHDPIVVPIWHCGLDELNPSDVCNNYETLKCILSRPKCLTIMVGPQIDFSNERDKLKSNFEQYVCSKDYRSQIHATFTNIVQRNLYGLKKRAEFEHRKFVNSCTV